MGLLKTTELPRRPFVSQSSARPVSYQGGETGMRIISGATGAMMRLAKHPAPTLSRQARARLEGLDYYEGHGANASLTYYEAHHHNDSLTCRHFGIGRSTFYHWKDRYSPRDLTALENRSRRPGRGRPWEPRWPAGSGSTTPSGPTRPWEISHPGSSWTGGTISTRTISTQIRRRCHGPSERVQ